MQILPNLRSSLASDAQSYNAGASYDNWSTSFSSLMSSYTEKASVQESLFSSPYGATTKASIESLAAQRTKTAADSTQKSAEQQLKMTSEDFAAMRDALKQAGYSDNDLTSLQAKINSDEGLTWSDFRADLKERLSTATTNTSNDTSADKMLNSELYGLFLKLNFSSQEAQQAMADLSRGAGSKVWNAISRKLAGMDPDSLTTITKSELDSLARAARLPDSARTQLSSLLGGQEQASFTPEGLKTVMGLVQQQAAQANAAKAQNAGSLKETLDKVMRRALDRAGIEKQADNKEAHASRIFIENGAEQQSAKSSTEKVGMSGQVLEDHKAPGVSAKTAEADNTEKKDHAARLVEGKNQFLDHQLGKDGKDKHSDSDFAKSDASAAQDKLMETLRAKVENKGFDPTARSADMSAAARNIDAAIAQTRQAADSSGQAAGFKSQPVPMDRLLQTIQGGIMKDLSDGAKQLTLRLDPPTLGNISVILTVKNKEVTGVIRAEDHEVSKMLNSQLEQIKQTLEEQGVKIQKLEVQTQLPQNQNGQSWQSAEQHNQTQEREAQLNLRSAWRRLREAGGGDAGLAQDMQFSGSGESISHTGLDLIA